MRQKRGACGRPSQQGNGWAAGPQIAPVAPYLKCQSGTNKGRTGTKDWDRTGWVTELRHRPQHHLVRLGVDPFCSGSTTHDFPGRMMEGSG